MKACQTGEDGKPGPEQMERLKKLISKIPDENIFNEKADFIKALADPTRLTIIYLLKQSELCVCEILTAMERPQPTVSHHLNILKKAGVIKMRKEGVWIHYSLSNPKITDIIEELFENS